MQGYYFFLIFKESFYCIVSTSENFFIKLPHKNWKKVEPQTFEMVQAELKRRNKARKYFSGTSIFSTKIQCAECGGWYGAKV